MSYYILLVIAAFWAIVAVLLNGKRIKEQQRANRNDKLQKFWYGKWMAEMEDHVITNAELQIAWDAYKALDIGTEEIETNYQQELLTEYEKVETMTNSSAYWCGIAEQLETIRLDHESFCLPILGEDILATDEEEPTPVYDSVIFEFIG